MFVYGIFEVLYSPSKIFKEIAKNPKYTGPLLILMLFLASNLGFVYAQLTKINIEKTMPKDPSSDSWTEDSSMWKPEGCVNSTDRIYGNSSIQCSSNETKIWMQLDLPENVNCSKEEGFKNISIRVKWIYSSESKVTNATLYLFSDSGYFYLNLTKMISNTSNIWYNITVPLGSENEWEKTGNPDWQNIIRLKIDVEVLNQSENAKLTLRIDGLFFRGVYEPLTNYAFSYLMNFSLAFIVQFVFLWIIFGTVLYALIRYAGGDILWKVSFISAGYVLITSFIQGLFNTAIIFTLPQISYPIEVIAPAKSEAGIAEEILSNINSKISFTYQAMDAFAIVIYAFGALLSTFAVRSLTDFSWKKSLIIGASTYITSIFLTKLLIGI